MKSKAHMRVSRGVCVGRSAAGECCVQRQHNSPHHLFYSLPGQRSHQVGSEKPAAAQGGLLFMWACALFGANSAEGSCVTSSFLPVCVGAL